MDGGFEYEGKTFPSLTAIAVEITGAHWSGPRFFGLVRCRALSSLRISFTAAALSRRRCTQIENLAFVVDRAPQPELPAANDHGQVSGAEELRPRALSEPDVILSYHPAPIVQPRP